ncbi:MAG: FixH family protein [Myxococcales bacterium]|nr:FixH family protein [Myxococcales bacterium]
MRRLSPLLTALFLAACGPAIEVPVTPSRTTLSTATVDTLSGELSSTAALTTGLTTVWLKLSENGAPITDATLTLLPVMTMPTKAHACPVVGEVVHEGDGVYRGQLVFQMASADMGTWSLGAKVVRGGVEKKLSFDVVVGDGGLVHAFTVADPMNPAMLKKYVLSVSFPNGTKVGMNPVLVTLHRMQDMMTFPAFDEAAFEMVPEMPAHGHGSSNNVSPTLVAPGRYEGQVNFTMPGEWKTTFTAKAAGELMTTKAFDTTL